MTGGATSTSAATSALAPIASVRGRLLLVTGHLPAARRPTLERRERLPCHVGVEHMKVRIVGQRTGQILARPVWFAERRMDQAGMKVQPSVLGPELQGLADPRPVFRVSPILDEWPGQHVVGVDVTPQAQLALCHLERPPEIDPAIGIEVRQLAAVEDLVERVEAADVFDEVVLLARLLDASQLCEDVTQRGR